MAFTTSPIETAPVGAQSNPNSPTKPTEFDLGFKEFIGYDPKGTTTVTGSQIDPAKPGPVVAATTTPGIETAKPDETITLSPKITALARKEQAQRQREQAFKQKEEQLAAKLADAEKYIQLKAKLAAKDFSAVEELGVNYDEFLKHELAKQTKNTPEEQRFKKVEEELASFKKQQEEQVIKDYQDNQALWKAEIKKVVGENPDFSTIKDMDAFDVVLQHVNDSFDEDGVELTVEQAAKDIEAALVARAEKWSGVTKIKNKQQATPEPGSKKLGAPNTITQDMKTMPVTTKTKPFHLMSESEQIAEAIRRVNEAKLKR
jgi:hypothetical protein